MSTSGISLLGSSALGAAAVAAGLLAGCGGSNSAQSPPPHMAHPNRSFRVYSDEPASGLHLSRGDCRALARLLGGEVGRHVAAAAEPSPPLSRCRLLARGVRVSIYLDAGYAARQRYENRMVEQAQFGAPDPARLPHPVAGVGDRSAGNHDASWVPAYSTLFAVRGNRWLTVAFAAGGEPRAQRRAEAAALARRAFELSAG